MRHYTWVLLPETLLTREDIERQLNEIMDKHAERLSDDVSFCTGWNIGAHRSIASLPLVELLLPGKVFTPDDYICDFGGFKKEEEWTAEVKALLDAYPDGIVVALDLGWN